MTVALYLRTSTEKQDTTNQLRQLSSFCETQGWTVGKVYTDIASGKNGDRTAFKALFGAASRREFDLVLFWSLDRFSREGVYETLQYLQRLTSYGVGYRSYSEQYLDSCGMFRDAVISILAVIAKQERVRLSERTLAGLSRARAQGKVLGRRPATDAGEVQRLVSSGMSLGEVSRQCGVSKTSIFRALRRGQ